MLQTLVLCITPKSNVRKIASLCCGLLLTVCVLKPLVQIEPETIAQSISKMQMDSQTQAAQVEVKNKQLVCQIIKEKTQAYILDKAQLLGLTLTAEVSVGGKDTYPYPTKVDLTGYASQAQKKTLTAIIEENLAITEENQIWHDP